MPEVSPPPVLTKTITLSVDAWSAVIMARDKYPLPDDCPTCGHRGTPMKLKDVCISHALALLDTAEGAAPTEHRPADTPYFNEDGSRNFWQRPEVMSRQQEAGAEAATAMSDAIYLSGEWYEAMGKRFLNAPLPFDVQDKEERDRLIGREAIVDGQRYTVTDLEFHLVSMPWRKRMKVGFALEPK